MSDEKTRELSFFSALAFLDVLYGTNTDPDDALWNDPTERRACEAHAAAFGWRCPVEAA